MPSIPQRNSVPPYRDKARTALGQVKRGNGLLGVYSQAEGGPVKCVLAQRLGEAQVVFKDS